MQRTPDEAWPHFQGWRVNYELIAYDLAYRLDVLCKRRTGGCIWHPIPPAWDGIVSPKGAWFRQELLKQPPGHFGLAFPHRIEWRPPSGEVRTDLVFMVMVQLAWPPMVAFVFTYALIAPARALNLPLAWLWPPAAGWLTVGPCGPLGFEGAPALGALGAETGGCCGAVGVEVEVGPLPCREAT